MVFLPGGAGGRPGHHAPPARRSRCQSSEAA